MDHTIHYRKAELYRVLNALPNTKSQTLGKAQPSAKMVFAECPTLGKG